MGAALASVAVGLYCGVQGLQLANKRQRFQVCLHVAFQSGIDCTASVQPSASWFMANGSRHPLAKQSSTSSPPSVAQEDLRKKDWSVKDELLQATSDHQAVALWREYDVNGDGAHTGEAW